MCLTLRCRDKVRVTKFPKLVWKIVKINGNNWEGPYSGTIGRQVFNEQLKAMENPLSGDGFVPIKHLITKKNCQGNLVIHPGFHAYRSLSSAKSNLENTRLFYVYTQKIFGNDLETILSVVPCIIPKGSEYCKGTKNEIVSIDIIVFKSFRDLIKNRVEFIKAL